MASLSGTPPKTTYKGLLKTDANTNISGSDQVITDGDGNATALSLSNTKVTAATLNVTTAATDPSETTVLLVNGSGDVVSRDLPEKSFEYNRLVARSNADTSPIQFAAVNNATANVSSINFGTQLSLGGSPFDNVIVLRS